MINFGDIIEYEYEQYVYFATINSSVYLGKIYSGELEVVKEAIEEKQTLEIKAERGSLSAQKKLSDSLCFVVLTTEKFRGDIAFCQWPPENSEEFNHTPALVRLNREDLLLIKDEIVNGNYPGGLKGFVKTIEISN